MPASGRQLIPLRATRSNAAILFVHGFLGDPSSTWRGFPGFLIGEPCLKNWDVFSFGYTTRARWDILGIWEADPSISILAGLLRTTASLSPLDQYQALAIIAHSMGGLVVQRALVDQPEFGQRVQFVLLFGTPSNGLIKAVPGRVAKQQLDDMAVGSSFLTALRKRWAERYRGGFPFYFRTAAGETDQFVPPNSSHDAFPLDVREVVPGNHLSMVKPDSASSPSVQLVVKAICQKAAVVDCAARALELGRFQDAIRELEPNKDKLDQGGLVRLALALEKTGRQEDAVRLLEERAKDLTDVMGTLAGRYKRRSTTPSRRTATAPTNSTAVHTTLQSARAKRRRPSTRGSTSLSSKTCSERILRLPSTWRTRYSGTANRPKPGNHPAIPISGALRPRRRRVSCSVSFVLRWRDMRKPSRSTLSRGRWTPSFSKRCCLRI